MDKKYTCKHCLTEFTNITTGKFASHIKHCEKNPNKKSSSRNENGQVECLCRFCKEHFWGDAIRQTLCDKPECRDKHQKSKMTQEVKARISKSRSAYIKEHPETFHWKKQDKFKSVPCEKFKEFLRSKNIQFVEEWQPLEDRHFCIDIAFPDTKIGIEINGTQHYNRDGTLKPYYQERHDLIESAGWKLIEVYYTTCFNLDLMEQIINVQTQPDYTEYFKIQEEQSNIKKDTCKKRVECREERIKLIKESNIDFSKLGWMKEVSTLIKMNTSHVCSWIKTYMPDLYNSSYKRIKTENEQDIYLCENCGNEYKGRSKSQLCLKCSHEKNRKVTRPSKEELEALIQKYPFLQIGKMFGVSDNAVRKWCKTYELQFRKSDINNTNI